MTSERASPAFRIAALVASLLMPPTGHAMAGHAARASAWLAVLFALSLASTLAAWIWLGALAVGAVLVGLAYVACSIDAYRASATRGNASVGAWLVFGFALCFVYFASPVVLALLLRWGALEAFKVPAAGMCPTLEIGDHVFVDKTAYRSRGPVRGDIVVYSRVSGGSPTDFVQRVVAIGGDAVEVRAGELFVNGARAPTSPAGRSGCDGKSLFEEDLGARHTIARDMAAPALDFRGQVPDGNVFVLGDNRDSSSDSRMAGPVPVDALRGRLWRRWLQGSSLRWDVVE